MNKTLLAIAALAAAMPAMADTAVVELTSGASRIVNCSVNAPFIMREDFSAPKADRFFAPAAQADMLSMDWGYCDEQYNAWPLGTGDIKMGILMDAESQKAFAGAQITAIQIANPVAVVNGQEVNPCKEATVWISNDIINEAVLASATGELGGAGFDWSSIKLDSPFTIPEEGPLFIGIDLNVPTSPQTYCYITDSMYPSYDNTGLVYSNVDVSPQGQLTTGQWGWRNWASAVGNLCFRVTIEGDNLPTDNGLLISDALPGTVVKGREFDASASFVNMGANSVNTVTFTLEIEGQEPQTNTLSAEGAGIGYNQSANAPLTFICDVEGINIPYTLYISDINGNPNNSDSKTTGYINCVNSGYDRNVVYEEATSNSCQYCVVGITGMETMRENYGDKGFIGIAVHSDFSTADPMASMNEGQCYDFMAPYVAGFPSAFADRNFGVSVYPSPDGLEESFLSLVKVPAIVDITGSCEVSGEKTATLTTHTEFSADIEQPFKIGYTIVEDQVGPYNQINGFSGGKDSETFGWGSKPQTVRMKFNDVARRMSEPQGVEGSVPATIEREAIYDWTHEIDLSNVRDTENCRIVVYVINETTGRIENAREIALQQSGVEGVAADKAAFAVAGKGAVELREAAAVYTVDGRCVARVSSASVVELPAGIYVVAAEGRTAKVVVR